MGNMPEIWFPNLGIKIEHLSRVAFTIFGRNIYWYGVIIGSGVLLALLLALHEAKRTGQNPEDYLDFALYGILFSVIGARMYYVFFSWDTYKDNLMKIFAIREGGLAIYGGILVGILTAIVYCRKKGIKFWLLADTTAPSLLLGQIMGRWGNFFNREAFGGYTDGLFAMRYLRTQVTGVSPEVLNHIVSVHGTPYIQVQPTFLYESMWNLVVFIILMILKRHKKFDGEIFGLYLFGYACGRVWIEGFRTDQLLFGGFAVSQVLSGILIVVALGILFYCKKQKDLLQKK